MITINTYIIMYSILQAILYCLIIRCIYRHVSLHNCVTIHEPIANHPNIYCAIENNVPITELHIHVIDEYEINYDEYNNTNITWHNNKVYNM